MWLQVIINENMAMAIVIHRSAEYLDLMSNCRRLLYIMSIISPRLCGLVVRVSGYR